VTVQRSTRFWTTADRVELEAVVQLMDDGRPWGTAATLDRLSGCPLVEYGGPSFHL